MTKGQTRLRCMTDSSMPCIESICHNIYRWERGTVGLTERYKLYYCVAVGISPDEFGAGRDASLRVPCLAFRRRGGGA